MSHSWSPLREEGAVPGGGDAPRPPAPSRGFLRNGGWNLAGLLVPVPVAVAAVPYLIAGLGEARFGLLTLAWAVMGYFTMFDLGLGRATTREIAAMTAGGSPERLRSVIWSSLSGHMLLGVIGCVLLAALSSPLTAAFELEPALASEFRASLLWLAASIPLLVLTSALRGVLEGFGRFDLVNIIRLPASVWTYAAPVVVVMFWKPELPAVVSAIVVGRGLSLLAHIAACRSVAPEAQRASLPSIAVLQPMVVLGWWLTVGTIVLPLMTFWDRFALGVQASPEAVGYYAAPYEVVTKLWGVSGAVMGAAFPAFTAAWASDRRRVGSALRHGTAVLFMAAMPAAIVIVVTASTLLPRWLGSTFGGEAVPVAQWLAIGVAASVVAQAGLTFLQASGHADRVAAIQVLEAVAYLAASWWAAGRWGATGVAVAWCARAVVDCVVLLAVADAHARSAASPAFTREQWAGLLLVPAAVFLLALSGGAAAHASPFTRAALACLGIGIALGWAWLGLVDREMRFTWRQALRRS